MEQTAALHHWQQIAESIKNGERPASDAMGNADLFGPLTTGDTGDTLPLLGTSSKIDAGTGYGVLSRVLYMVPAKGSGREACAGRSQGCTLACLAEGTGRMSMHQSQRARRRRHAAFYADRTAFLRMLHGEIAAHERSAARQGKIAAVRLNGTTDLPWHRMSYTLADGTRFARIHDAFPDVRFYEYTKHPLSAAAKGGIPANLSLTFSLSERPDAERYALDYLRSGHGVAIVMAIPRHEPPSTWRFYGEGESELFRVIDGDAHDARFLDPTASIVALAAKGNAKGDRSGFVRTVTA